MILRCLVKLPKNYPSTIGRLPHGYQLGDVLETISKLVQTYFFKNQQLLSLSLVLGFQQFPKFTREYHWQPRVEFWKLLKMCLQWSKYFLANKPYWVISTKFQGIWWQFGQPRENVFLPVMTFTCSGQVTPLATLCILFTISEYNHFQDSSVSEPTIRCMLHKKSNPKLLYICTYYHPCQTRYHCDIQAR